MAACSGLALSPERRPLLATSLGTGEMTMEASSTSDVRRVVVGVGGSASTDGGTGAARALGWRFMDSSGRELPAGGGALVDLAHIAPGASPPVDVIGACDVDSPLVGQEGAARSFGPQKGASQDDIERLDEGLTTLARVIESDLGWAVSDLPHAGAGGGMGAGLIAFFDAQLRYGFDLLDEAVGFSRALAVCDVVITGEGSFDEQTSKGKVARRVAQAASALGIPCILVAGAVRADPGELFAGAADVSAIYGSERAVYEAEAAVAKSTMEAISKLL
jgi:glycerate kinase